MCTLWIASFSFWDDRSTKKKNKKKSSSTNFFMPVSASDGVIALRYMLPPIIRSLPKATLKIVPILVWSYTHHSLPHVLHAVYCKSSGDLCRALDINPYPQFQPVSQLCWQICQILFICPKLEQGQKRVKKDHLKDLIFVNCLLSAVKKTVTLVIEIITC